MSGDVGGIWSSTAAGVKVIGDGRRVLPMCGRGRYATKNSFMGRELQSIVAERRGGSGIRPSHSVGSQFDVAILAAAR
jgi:hypothetical protein